MSYAVAVASAALLALPLPTAAQPAAKVPKLGYLRLGARGSETNTIDGLRQGLRELGYVVIVNLRTADALGLKIPQSVLIQADQVIR